MHFCPPVSSPHLHPNILLCILLPTAYDQYSYIPTLKQETRFPYSVQSTWVMNYSKAGSLVGIVLCVGMIVGFSLLLSDQTVRRSSVAVN